MRAWMLNVPRRPADPRTCMPAYKRVYATFLIVFTLAVGTGLWENHRLGRTLWPQSTHAYIGMVRAVVVVPGAVPRCAHGYVCSCGSSVGCPRARVMLSARHLTPGCVLSC